jgi:hypothetical protein
VRHDERRAQDMEVVGDNEAPVLRFELAASSEILEGCCRAVLLGLGDLFVGALERVRL